MASNRLETISRDFKFEISSLKYNHQECLALLSGFLITNGNVSLKGKNLFSLSIKTEVAGVARLIFNIFKNELNLESTHILYENKSNFNKKRIVYKVLAENVTLEIVEKLELMKDLMMTLPIEMTSKDHIRGFCAGCFLGSGSLADPEKNYYIEITFKEREICEFVCDRLNNLYKELEFVYQYSFKTIERRNKFVLYMKRGENIADFIKFLGCSGVLLKFEEIRIEKDYYNSENRYDNFLVANYQRAIKSAQEQVEMINRVLKKIPLSYFDEKEQAIINSRLENPEGTYKELINYMYEKYGVISNKSKINQVFNKLKSYDI